MINLNKNSLMLEELIAVHLTRFIPQNNRIIHSNTAIPNDSLRFTVHFTMNYGVENHVYGNWDNCRYAVIVPLKSLCGDKRNNLRVFNVSDTYFLGDVYLPEGTIVVNASGKQLDPEQKAEFEAGKIKYVECKEDIREAVKRIIHEEGFMYQEGMSDCWQNCIKGSRENQEGLASQLGAVHKERHCDDILAKLEEYASYLVWSIRGESKKYTEYCIDILLNTSYVQHAKALSLQDPLSEDESDEIKESQDIVSWTNKIIKEDAKAAEGKRNLEILRGQLEYITETMAKLNDVPEGIMEKTKIFIDNAKKEIREYIPKEVAEFYKIPAY